jgi:hypothetical protein
VGTRANLDAVARRKKSISYPCRILNPGLARSLVTTLTDIMCGYTDILGQDGKGFVTPLPYLMQNREILYSVRAA